MTQLNEPSAIKVGLYLCLASLIFGFTLYLLEYIVGSEIAGISTISTIMPAMVTGIYFGSKSGEFISPKTRWSALSIWIAASFTYAFLLFYYYEIPLSEVTAIIDKLGWFSLIILVVFLFTFLIAYAAFKFGEKTGIKNFQQKQKKSAKNVDHPNIDT